MFINSSILFLAFGASVLAKHHYGTPKDLSRVINITLTPVVTHDKISGIAGEYILHYHTKKNHTLVDIPISLAGKPTAAYNTETLTAKDKKGKLKLLASEGEDADGQPTRYFRPIRDTEGPVTVRFTAKPNNKTYPHIGPLFDLRENGLENVGGIVGSSWALLPGVSNLTQQYDWSYRWDLRHAPKGTNTAWTWGEGAGPFYLTAPRADVLYTYFSVGKLSQYPPTGTRPVDPKHKFGMYWLDEPVFNATELAGFINSFFNYSTTFWQDQSSLPYRVFIRHNARGELGSGGTALNQSFSFGWNAHNETNQEYLRLLISHEMTHNWAIMPGAGALNSRWAEGMAEFYSLRLLWRAHLLNTTTYAKEMNYRVNRYYINPYVNYTDEAAYDLAWKDAAAQHIPYGRGLIELANIDAEVRNKSKNAMGLDFLTLKMRKLCVTGSADCTPATWLKYTADYLGPSAVTEYNRTTSGKPVIQPLPGSLGPCFDVVQTESNPQVWQWRAKKEVDIESEKCII
ncbi:hypothetical protein BFJ70_g15458 [Fusarium oxysporum]|nr:hypothetical protein BFJ70_g15458 [Fusarium oxysporum]